MKDRNFRSLIRNERQRFVNYVASLLNEAAAMDAEDIVQDVLLRILGKPDLNIRVENMTAYVFRSLRNRVIDSGRTNKNTLSLDGGNEGEQEQESGKLIDGLVDRNPNAMEVLQTQEGKEELFAALETLNDLEQAVIRAHELEGVPFKQLSEMWSIPQNTLLFHKARAMKKLREHFQIK